MGEVTHTPVLNQISDDEERKIAIMWHIEPTHVWWGGKNLRNCDIILAQSWPTRGWWWGASVPARSKVSSVKHKNGPIPSHKASQNFSIRPLDSKLNFRKSIILHMKHEIARIPSRKASQNFSLRPFDNKLNFRKSIFLHMKHKIARIPSHKASQNFSIRPFDSKLNFRKSIFYIWSPDIHIKWCPCIY